MKRIFPLLLMVLTNVSLKAQTNVPIDKYIPKVGEKIVDYTYKEVMNHSKSTAAISEFRGKWLVVDYWSTGCSGCMASMPKIDKMSKDFKGKAEFLLVGLYTSPESGTRMRSVYNKLIKKFDLTLRAAYDSGSIPIFKPRSVPYIFIINPEGVLVAKTYSLDSTLLASFIEGKNPPYIYTYSDGEKWDDGGWKMELPLLTNGSAANGGVDTSFMFRSILTKWVSPAPGLQMGWKDGESTWNKNVKKGQAFAYGSDLSRLLLLAVLGQDGWGYEDSLLWNKFSDKIIVETSDKRRFQKGNMATGENLYSYSIISPGFSESKLREYMLRELEDIFDFQLKVEERDVPAYKLVVTDREKLEKARTKYSKLGGYLDKRSNKWVCQAQSLSMIAANIQYASYYNDPKQNLPVVDDTHIDMKIDYAITQDLFAFEEVQKDLGNYGLRLEKGTTKMRCLVVKDRQRGYLILSSNN